MKDLAQEFTQRFWVGNLDTRLPLLAAFIAILLLAHSLARLTWNVLPQPQLDTPAVQQERPHIQRVTREQPFAKKITDYNLFGKFEPKKVEAAPVQPAVVPETRLNLKLRGVFASEDKTAARAIIADSRGDEDSYRIGSQVPGGAILNEIYPDRVILEHNGRLETLKLPVDEMPDSNAGPSTTAGAAGGAAVAPGSRTPGSSISGRDIAQASASTQDNAALLGQYRDALMNDPNSVMGLVNVRPYQKDGQLVGYRIRPGKDRALLRRFGLRSGDVVTAVNGVPMNNPVKALEVLRDLSSATQLTVDIERNGSPQSFTFQIQ